MADRKLSGAYVWLALASAAVVFVASGVAMFRIADRGDESPSAAAPEFPSTPAGAPSRPSVSGPVSGGAPAAGGSAAAGTAAEQAAPVSAPFVPGQIRSGTGMPAAKSAGSASASAASAPSSTNPGGAVAAAGSTGSTGSAGSGGSGGGSPQSGGAQGSGSQGGGQASPPAPSQQPPEKQPLVAASVSAGKGAQGGVVGVGVGDSPDADVTVGTTQLLGNHPPSQGTGVMFSGRFLNPPPALPLPPG